MGVSIITAGEGQPIARCYGEHLIAGHILMNRDIAPRALLLLLGKGEWAGAVNLWYNAEKLPTSAYNFHPGTLSSGINDPLQGVDSFYPQSGLTYNRMAYTGVRIPDTYDSVDPSGVVGRYQCQVVADYDDFGRAGAKSYSPNPARVFADVWLEQAKLSPDRIDWASWYDWKETCRTSIPWIDGRTVDAAGNPVTRMIPRFDAHVKFTGPVEVVDVINLLTRLSATTWQDTGAKIVFFPPNAQTAPFLFDGSVLVDDSVKVFPTDSRQLPTYARVLFRNIDSEVLAPAKWTARSRTPESTRGKNGLADAQFDAMTYSQAMRLAWYYLNRARSTSRRCKFDAYGRSLGVLSGDIARINHRLTKGQAEIEILEATDLGDQRGARRFLSAIRKESILYRDTDHEPIPAQIELNAA